MIPPILFEDMAFCSPSRLLNTSVTPWEYIKNWRIYFKTRLLQKHNIKIWSCIDTECQSVLLLPHDVSYTRRFPLQKQTCWSVWGRCGRLMVMMSARVQIRQRQPRDDTISKNCHNSNVPLPRQWHKWFPCLHKHQFGKVNNNERLNRWTQTHQNIVENVPLRSLSMTVLIWSFDLRALGCGCTEQTNQGECQSERPIGS